jgi:hypothetical protein
MLLPIFFSPYLAKLYGRRVEILTTAQKYPQKTFGWQRQTHIYFGAIYTQPI